VPQDQLNTSAPFNDCGAAASVIPCSLAAFMHGGTEVDQLATGRVLQFDSGRGYGFVAADDGGEDIFLHASVFDGDLDELVPGTRVEFQVMAGDRGRKAFAAHLVAGEDEAGEPAPSPLAPFQQVPPVVPGPRVQLEPEPATPTTEREEQMCDALSADEFGQELTELLLTSSPTLTSQQILQVRHGVLEVAAKHGWLDT
jgi:CspA family cold shock protein